MFNKQNNQQHYGQGHQYINQNVTNNFFVTYDTPQEQSDSNNNPLPLLILPLAIFFTSGMFLLETAKKNQELVIIGSFIILLTTNLYIFIRSKDIKLTLQAIFPSAASLLSIFQALNHQLPQELQIILNSMSNNIDFSSLENAIHTLLTHSLINFLTTTYQSSQPNIVITFIYLIFVFLLLATPLFIAVNAVFKKSIRNYGTYFIILFFWILLFALKMNLIS